MIMRKNVILSSWVVLVLAGCSLTPKYERPMAPVPATVAAEPSIKAEQDPASLLGWKEVFVDPQLQRLIDLGLRENRDLREALLNVSSAQAQYRVQRSGLMPNIGVYGEGARQRVPGDLSPTGRSTTMGEYGVGGLASYEVDFFGRVRSLSDQALERYLATEEGYRSAYITLVSEISSAYLSWVIDNQLWELAKEIMDAARPLLTWRRCNVISVLHDIKKPYRRHSKKSQMSLLQERNLSTS